MSDPKQTPARPGDLLRLQTTRQRKHSGKHPVWKLVPPKPGENCRWEAWDGRWLTLTHHPRGVVVATSDGRREVVATWEGALDLAKQWRS
jgi:hypothetical protein